MTNQHVPVIEKILGANDKLALLNLNRLNQSRIFSINMMASPGAGKTSLILKTIELLKSEYKIGVIEGDTAPVTIDADKIITAGMPAVQVNTGGECHMDALMVASAIDTLPLDQLDLLIVENVGNLICPAAFSLGTHASVLIASIPEGDDKPYKYPAIYKGIDALVINKIDLLPYVSFRMDYFIDGVSMLNRNLVTFPLSCSTGEGFAAWIEWIKQQLALIKE